MAIVKPSASLHEKPKPTVNPPSPAPQPVAGGFKPTNVPGISLGPSTAPITGPPATTESTMKPGAPCPSKTPPPKPPPSSSSNKGPVGPTQDKPLKKG